MVHLQISAHEQMDRCSPHKPLILFLLRQGLGLKSKTKLQIAKKPAKTKRYLYGTIMPPGWLKKKNNKLLCGINYRRWPTCSDIHQKVQRQISRMADWLVVMQVNMLFKDALSTKSNYMWLKHSGQTTADMDCRKKKKQQE
jgi:hypothetical protein